MNDSFRKAGGATKLSRKVGAKVERKIKAGRKRPQGAWTGLGTIGLIGWSIVVPTLAGAGFGLWLDNLRAGSHFWTPLTLVAGIVAGCMNAWYWVRKEEKKIREDQEDNDA